MIKLIIVDVDGVLTDGTVVIGETDAHAKRFHVHDGLGLRLAMLAGKTVAIMTAAGSDAVLRRAEQLGVTHVYQYVRDKGAALEKLRDELGLDADEVCYIGDDLLDLPALARAGLPVAVGDAAEEVKAAAALVTSRPGGHGAVREAVEHILRGEGLWEDAIARLDTTKEATT